MISIARWGDDEGCIAREAGSIVVWEGRGLGWIPAPFARVVVGSRGMIIRKKYKLSILGAGLRAIIIDLSRRTVFRWPVESCFAICPIRHLEKVAGEEEVG